jgi:hypothetical protein
MLQLSATRCSCISILSVSLVGFAAITLCVASQRVFIVVSVYVVIDSVRKLLDQSDVRISRVPVRTTCAMHPILLDLIALTILRAGYKV